MILPVLQTAGAVVTATLALSSGLNMYQTFQVSRGMNDENDLAFRLCIEERMPSSRRLQVALDEIVGLSRSDALKCFKTSCRAPLSLSEIGGEWDGILLDNNGIIMTEVSRFLTNVLFGRRKKWNGKIFGPNTKGINRFYSNKHSDHLETAHHFDFIIQPSSLVPNVTSVGLRYSDYQNFLSPWYSMRDEVRLLELPSPVEFEIMIGFGCMKWSGGFLNGAPFCLYREKEIVPQLPK